MSCFSLLSDTFSCDKLSFDYNSRLFSQSVNRRLETGSAVYGACEERKQKYVDMLWNSPGQGRKHVLIAAIWKVQSFCFKHIYSCAYNVYYLPQKSTCHVNMFMQAVTFTPDRGSTCNV